MRGGVLVAGAEPPQARPRLPGILQDLYANDPLLEPALACGLSTEAMAKAAEGGQPVKRNDVKALGETVARLMTEAGGPQVVAVSLDGFDTHANQGPARASSTAPDLSDAGADGCRAWAPPGSRRPWSWPPSSAAPPASTAPTAPTTAPPRPRCCSAAR